MDENQKTFFFFFGSKTGAGKLCPIGQIRLPPLLINKAFLAHRHAHVHTLSAAAATMAELGILAEVVGGCEARTLTLWPFSRTGVAALLQRNQRMDTQTRRNSTVFRGTNGGFTLFPSFFSYQPTF